jgi:hypothetical protein
MSVLLASFFFFGLFVCVLFPSFVYISVYIISIFLLFFWRTYGLICALQTNYIDRLDPALLRLGRIDRKIAYGLATAHQAHALFMRFFPEARFPEYASKDLIPPGTEKSLTETPASALANSDLKTQETNTDSKMRDTIPVLAGRFAALITPMEFSTAELQCYLQAHKTAPAAAVAGVGAWVEEQRAERRAREAREAERTRARRERRAGMMGQPVQMGMGMRQAGTGMGMGQAGLMGMGTGIAGAGMNMGMGLDPAVAALFPGGLGVHRGLAQPKEHSESEGEGSPDNASGSEFSAYVDVPVVVAE